MKIKKPLAHIVAVTLSVTTLLILQSPKASAAVITWDGVGGATGSMNDDDNWVGGNAPTTGDTAIFPGGSFNEVISFDLESGEKLASLQIGTGALDNYLYTFDDAIDTDAITSFGVGSVIIRSNQILTSPLTLDSKNSSMIALDGIISGSSNLTKSGLGIALLSGANTYTSNTLITEGELQIIDIAGLGAGGAGGTVISSGASLLVDVSGDGLTFAEPLIMSGLGSSTNSPTLNIGRGSGNASEITVSSLMSLSSNDVRIGSDRPVVLSGSIVGTGGFNFVDTSSDNSGSLKMTGSNGFTSPVLLSDLAIINSNQSTINFTVNNSGILKGTGTVGVLSVLAGGRVAPGLSPGCLSAGNTTIAGSFDVEIGGTTACTEYDQLQVTGTVNLSGGTLNVSRWNGFNPTAGQTYTIITNDLADSTGTFAGLAQGATVTVDGFTFTISYTGGDGNDVVLTSTGGSATTPTPGTPNTGIKLIMSNPLATLLVSTLSAGTLLFIAKRYKVISPRIR